MRIPVATMGLTLTVGMLLVMQGGCSKKSIQSGGDAQSTERGMAKSGGPAPAPLASTGGMDAPSATFPDLSLSSKPDDLETGGLRGFDSVSGGKAPSEERLGGGGTMLAKVEPSESTARQIEDIRREQAKEQAASAEAGLRDVFFGYDSWTITEEGQSGVGRKARQGRAELSGRAWCGRQPVGSGVLRQGTAILQRTERKLLSAEPSRPRGRAVEITVPIRDDVT